MSAPFNKYRAIAIVILISAGIVGVYHYHSNGASLIGNASNLQNRSYESGIFLTDQQLQSVRVEHVSEHSFAMEREAVGNIAFNDEKTVQVFSPYQGKIVEVYAKAGDEVKLGSPLFSINSPDLLQAESSLIAAAGTFKLTGHVLERDKQLFEIHGISQKEYQQAISDQQAAEGAFNAAKNAVRIFDITDDEIEKIVEKREVNPIYIIKSPNNGKVTARNAAVGLVVQPGSLPTPFSVSDTFTMWMVANVAETDIPLVKSGQDIEVKVMALPNRVFNGRITNISAAVDSNTHRAQVRSEIKDPVHQLRAGMFATFKIHLGGDRKSLGVPVDSVARESDGSISVWVTTDGHHFSKRIVKIGMQQNGLFQIVDGLYSGEMIATEGAIFLSNTLNIEVH